MSIMCETYHKIIIRRNNDVYIFDILHDTESTFTRRPVPINDQILTSD